MTDRVEFEPNAELPAVRVERPWLAWGIPFLLASVILCFTDYQSTSGDSRYYNEQVSQLLALPVSQWIAPKWGDNHYGRDPDDHFRDHPAGHFVPGAILAQLGMPSRHALHLVGMLSQLISIVVLTSLAARFVAPERALAILWALQLMPISVSHGIRANHEQAMLLAVVLAIYGAVRMVDNFAWALLVAAAVNGIFFIKGLAVVIGPVLAVVAFVAAAGRERRERIAPGLAVLACVTLTVPAVIGLHELAYRSATGGVSFLAEYWPLQIESRSWSHDGNAALSRLDVLGYYLQRLLVYTLPWSALALLLGFVRRPDAPQDAGARRLTWILAGSSVTYILVFSLSPRHASRYVYPSFFLLAVPLVVYVVRQSATLTRLQRALNRIGPHRSAAALWFVLFSLHLAIALLGRYASG